MAQFSLGHSDATDWRDACRIARAGLGGAEDANLGFIYVTEGLASYLGDILEDFRTHTGIANWVGAVGMGVIATGAEYFNKPALTVMAGTFPPDSFRVFAPIVDGFEGFETDNADWISSAQPALGVVHGDPRNPQLAEIIAGFGEMLPSYLVGGLTMGGGMNSEIANGLAHGGLSGVLFASSVPVATGLSQGCTPIGPQHEITDSRDNILITMDGRPALEVYKEDVGALDEDVREPGNIKVAIPVARSDTGDYLVRDLVGVSPEHGLVAINHRIEDGDRLMFCRRDRDAAETDLRRMLNSIKARTGGPPKGGVYYSCVARGPNLFGAESEEIGIIREALGDFPLVGFFANGEISHDRLYGYTGVLALFL